MELADTWVVEPAECPTSFILKHDGLTPDEVRSFKCGSAVSVPGVPLELRVNIAAARLRRFDVFVTNRVLYVMREEVADAVSLIAGTSVQFIECRLRTADQIVERLKLLVVAALVRLIDIEASEVSLIPNSEAILSIGSMRLLPYEGQMPALFRDPAAPALVFARKAIVQLFNKNAWTGFRFVEAPGYRF